MARGCCKKLALGVCCFAGVALIARANDKADNLFDAPYEVSLSLPASRQLASQASTSQASASHGSSVGHNEHHKSPAFDPIVFLMITIFASCVSQQAVSFIPHKLRPPHSVVLYSIGMLLKWMAGHDQTNAASADWHVIKRVLPSSIILAIPGVIVNTVLTALIIYAIDVVDFKPALLLGSILSATDPVAVVGALSALQAPLKLSSIISGESLLNDGSAVVLFQIFLEVAAGRQEFEIGHAVQKLARLAGGGVAFGLAVALLAHIWLVKTKNFMVEMLLIVLCIFGTFFVAEHSQFGFSGVLACVTFGFFMAAYGKYDLAQDKEHEHHAIVGFLAFLCNESIFIIGGVVGYRFSFESIHIGALDWGHLAILYVGVHITRGATVGFCYPILSRIGYQLTIPEATICVFGGLRGAVGLALGLLVLGDTDLEQHIRDKICFHTNGIVLGTLFLNGVLITPLYKALKIQSPNRAEHHEKLLKCLLSHGDHRVAKRRTTLEQHWFFEGVDLPTIDKIVPGLVDELFHAEEDFYGRRKHCKGAKNNMNAAMNDLIPTLIDVDHVDLYKNKTRSSITAAHCNMFHHGDVAKHHKKARDKAREQQFNDAVAEAELQYEKRSSEVQNLLEEVKRKSIIIDSAHEDEALALREIKTGSVNVKSSSTVPQVECFEEEINIDCVVGTDQAFQSESGSPHKPRSSMEKLKKAMMNRGSTTDIGHESKYTFFRHIEKTTHETEEAVNGLFLELQVCLINAKRAAYKQMYETEVVNKASLDYLLASVDFQTEACNGDLPSRGYSWLTAYKPGLQNESQMVQMREAPMVAYQFIKANLTNADGFVLRNLVAYAGTKSRILQWMLLTRNVKVLLAYVLVSSENIEELRHLRKDIFETDPTAQDVVDGVVSLMTGCIQLAKEELLMLELQMNPEMFKLYEHCLFGRLLVVQQVQVLKELGEEGGIKEEDLEHFLKNMTSPTMKTLTGFVPSLAQLKAAGCTKCDDYSPALDGFLEFLGFFSTPD